MAKRVFEIPDLPGSELLEQSAQVTGLELAVFADAVGGSLDAFDSMDAVSLWGRVASWAQARQAQAAADAEAHVTAIYGPGDSRRPGPTSEGPGDSRSRHAIEPRASREIAMPLSISRPAAAALIKTGRALTGSMAATGEALADGRLCWAKARAITGGLIGLPEPLVMDVEDSLLPQAPGRTPAQLRRDVAKLVVAADPEGATERHQSARADRRVNRPSPLPDGMARISAVLPAEDALALDLSLDGAARHARSQSDERSSDQLRADALAAVGHHALSTGRIELPLPEEVSAEDAGAEGQAPATEPGALGAHAPEPSTFPTEGSKAPRINITMPVNALIDALVDDEHSGTAGVPARGQAPRAPSPPGAVDPPSDELPDPHTVAELNGYGAIDPVTARCLAAGGIWRRLVTDPRSGTVLDVGRDTYRPPADLARHIRARDRTCTRPGCSVRAEACELDHVESWDHGGATSAANLVALCPSDHRAKSRGEFQVTHQADGAIEWTSSTGHTYRRGPDGTVVHLGRGDAKTDPSAEPPPY